MKSLYNNVLLLTIGLLSISILSCRKIIDLDLPDQDPRLVVNSYLVMDSTITINVCQSQSALADEYNFKTISGATVEIYEDEQFLGTASEKNDGTYEINLPVKTGTKYAVNVSIDGFESVIGEDIIPSRSINPEIDEIKQVKNSYGEDATQVTFSFDDPKGANFYEVMLYNNRPLVDYYSDEDTVYYDTVGYYLETIYFYDVSADFSDFDDSAVEGLYSDELFDGERHTMSVEFYQYYYHGDGEERKEELILEVRRVSEAYYRYKTSRVTQYYSEDNPFAEAAPVFNNIVGGYGIFAGYAADRDYQEYEPSTYD